MKELLNYKEGVYVFQCQECDCIYATDEVEVREDFWKDIVLQSTCLKCGGINRLHPDI